LLVWGTLFSVLAHGAELERVQAQIAAAAEALKQSTPRTEEWRKAHGNWLQARISLVHELYNVGEVARSLAELDAVEKDLMPGEDAACRISVIEARVNALMRAPSGWEKARVLLDQAERAAAPHADTSLPLLVLLTRIDAANNGQQYDEALASVKRLLGSPALRVLSADLARDLRVQAHSREALTYHYMGKLAASKLAAVAGIEELNTGTQNTDTRTLEARLRSSLAATHLALDEQAEALTNADSAIAWLSTHPSDRAGIESLASAYLTRAALRCKQDRELAAKGIRADFAESQRLYEQCYGPQSASLLPLLTTHGWALMEIGDLDAASQTLERGLRLARTSRVAPYLQLSLLENLCRLRLRQRRQEEAWSIAATMRDTWKERVPLLIAAGSETDRLNMLRECSWLDCAMASRVAPPSDDDTLQAAEAVLGTYGLVFDSLLRDAALTNRLPQDQRLRYLENRAKLSAMTLNLPSTPTSDAADEVSSLRRILRDFEGPQFIDAAAEGLVHRLQQALPTSGALVVFSPFRSMDGRTSERLAAAIVTAETVQVLQVPASRDSIRSAADELQAALTTKSESSEVSRLLRALKEILWFPLQPHLADATQLYFCLDASMKRVPVPVWSHPRVTFLTSPQALLRKPAPHRPLADATATWLLVNAGEQAVTFPKELSFPYDIVRHLPKQAMPQLPGAAREIAAIESNQSDRWARLHSDTDDGAPEESSFMGSLLDPPAIIHFAGHAASRDPGVESSTAASLWWEGVEQPRALWCSCLIFPKPQPAEAAEDLASDNFLFAAEIAGLDLNSTQLVTLSACDTGAGISPKSEGHYSLARAFHTAGVRDVLSATEAIPDGPTVDLMLPFYRRIAKGDDAAQALWEEQHKLIKDDDPATLRAFGFFRLTRAWVKTEDR